MLESGKGFTLQGLKIGRDLIFKSSCKFILIINQRILLIFYKTVPKLAAKQFCIIDSRAYAKIAPSELLIMPGGDDDKVEQSVNRLQDWVNRFNGVSNWTSACILETHELSSRIKILKQFIRLARECLGMKNFNTSYAIISGLNHSSIQRLTKTWQVNILFFFI